MPDDGIQPIADPDRTILPHRPGFPPQLDLAMRLCQSRDPFGSRVDGALARTF
jgi:hypothetical protein